MRGEAGGVDLCTGGVYLLMLSGLLSAMAAARVLGGGEGGRKKERVVGGVASFLLLPSPAAALRALPCPDERCKRGRNKGAKMGCPGRGRGWEKRECFAQ